jgi:hypothetical protein
MSELPCDLHGNSYGTEVCPDCLDEVFAAADEIADLPRKLRLALERIRPDEREGDE